MTRHRDHKTNWIRLWLQACAIAPDWGPPGAVPLAHPAGTRAVRRHGIAAADGDAVSAWAGPLPHGGRPVRRPGHAAIEVEGQWRRTT
jgi:hypothetical protein